MTQADLPAVLVTRPRPGAASMARLLEDRGLEARLLPAVEIRDPADSGPLRRALDRLDRFDGVAFTSANGVRAVADHVDSLPPGLHVAAVGPATAREVERRFGRSVDLLPPQGAYTAAGLVSAWESAAAEGAPPLPRRVLLPLAQAAAQTLELGLRRSGCEVVRVTAYRSVAPAGAVVDRARAALLEGRLALVTFTSPSCAAHTVEALGESVLAVPAACIGPVTAEAAAELGFRVVAVPEEHTVPALVAAVARVLAAPPEPGGPPSVGLPEPPE